MSAKLGDRVRARVSVGGGVYKSLVDLCLLLFTSPCFDIQVPKIREHSPMAVLSSKKRTITSDVFAFPFAKTCPRCGMNTGTTIHHYISLGLLFQN